MRFCSINIYSGEHTDGNIKKELTKLLRNDSNIVVDAYLKSLKYYTNENCISLNISCDEDTEGCFLEEIAKGYPVLHIPFDLDGYVKLPESSKDEYWLTVIRNAIEYVCNIWNCERAFFDNVYLGCLNILDKE